MRRRAVGSLLVLMFSMWIGPSGVRLAPAADLGAEVQSLLHTLDYLAVDYPSTVAQGSVTDADEYAEQREFAQALLTRMQRLPDDPRKPVLRQQAERIAAAIEQRLDGDAVRQLCAELSAALIAAYEVRVAPTHLPPLATAATLFQQNCASCHGAEGFGNGPAAAALQPRPSNFHDRERQAQRSVYSLYSTITLGVEGTAMPSFARLPDDQRWALAFYVSDFFATPAERARGQELWQQGRYREHFPDLGHLTRATPAAIATETGPDGLAVLAYLRSAPDRLKPDRHDPLALAQTKLAESLAAYQTGDPTRAYDLAVAAYLEGFELAEVGLNTVDPALKRRIETAMARYRQAIQEQVPHATLAAQAADLQTLLTRAAQRLDSTALSPGMSFAGAFIILLREGLEAILVLAAMTAFLARLQRRDALRYVHAGWIGALGAGFLTWLATKSLIRFSGAGRELTEGFTALFAMAMLVYVGFWLHNQTHTRRWQSFLHGKMRQTLSQGTLWSLAFVAFIAVYREAVETVLFYETLWLQTPPAAQHALLLGLASAALSLIGLAWVIFRCSFRLPLRRFFQVNAALLFALAVVFAGKGIAALQEAGRLRVDVLDIPTIEVLGIYPTLESVGLQLGLIAAIVIWVLVRRRQQRLQAS